MARWRVHEPVAVPPALREAVGGHPLLATLLAQRGITDPGAARRFLDPQYYSPSCSFALPGVCRAKQVLAEAALTRAPVRIWGDLDVDGQTSTALLYEALTALGCRADYRIPGRSLGHGFPPHAVREAVQDGIRLIVTCDTGVTDVATVALANELGINVIITDHHDLGDVLPDAAAVVNPKMLPADHPARELSGVGVAYMLACAMLDAPRFSEVRDAMLDLVAVGLVADVAAQVGDVRYWIQRGLPRLRQGRRPGLAALLRSANIDCAVADEQTIGFQIAPRLNALGRLGDANLGVELLLTQSVERANELAATIDGLNVDRRARTEAVFARVDELVRRDPAMLREPAIIVGAADLEDGVIGLVAGRLAQAYGRPAIVVAHRAGQPSIGSARSVEGVDIHAAIASQRALLVREGGHPMAAGFALEAEAMDAFCEGIQRWLRENAPAAPPEQELEIAAVIPWDEADLPLAQQIARLGPFGPGNPQPLFVAEGGVFLRAEDVSRWRETAHRRLFVSAPNGEPHRLTWFNAGSLPEPGEAVDMVFMLQVNRYNGREEARLALEAWRPAEPKAPASTPPIVAGIEVVDWRHELASDDLLGELHAEFEDDVLVYPAQLGPLTPHVALALADAPTDQAELSALLDAIRPQVIYLMPVASWLAAETAPGACLQRVAGMVKLAIGERAGQLDLTRMAAAARLPASAVAAALEWLAATGKVALGRNAAGLWAARDAAALPATTPAYPQADATAALERLAFLLGESAAYRRLWASADPAQLLRDLPA